MWHFLQFLVPTKACSSALAAGIAASTATAANSIVNPQTRRIPISSFLLGLLRSRQTVMQTTDPRDAGAPPLEGS